MGDRRLHETALAPPALPFVDHQPVAEEESGALENVALPIIVMVLHQNVMVVLGKRDQIDRSKSQIEADQVVVLSIIRVQNRTGLASMLGRAPTSGYS